MVDADTRPAEAEPSSPPRVAVVQDGARLHYAVPLALARAGALRVMFSEAFFPSNSWLRPLLEHSPLAASISMRGWLERRCDEISPDAVRTNLPLVIRQQWMRRRIRSDEAFYEWSSAAVGRWIRRNGYRGASTLFGFVRNVDSGVIEDAHKRGLCVVVDQFIAPAVVEAAEASIQRERWPGWAGSSGSSETSRLEQIEQRSWSGSDRVTCASDYVRRGLIAQGVADARIAVNPYPIDTEVFREASRIGRQGAIGGVSGGAITIGFVGSVGLRKGAPCFLQVARRLASSTLKFVMVGPIDLTAVAERELRGSVELIGRVGRAEVANWLSKFDLFFFPSTCEGSAGTVMEAMASGLPIITSPNSGTIVRDRIDGFVRNYDDVDGFAERIELLARDASLRQQMGKAARRAAQANNLERFGRCLLETISARV